MYSNRNKVNFWAVAVLKSLSQVAERWIWSLLNWGPVSFSNNQFCCQSRLWCRNPGVNFGLSGRSGSIIRMVHSGLKIPGKLKQRAWGWIFQHWRWCLSSFAELSCGNARQQRRQPSSVCGRSLGNIASHPVGIWSMEWVILTHWGQQRCAPTPPAAWLPPDPGQAGMSGTNSRESDKYVEELFLHRFSEALEALIVEGNITVRIGMISFPKISKGCPNKVLGCLCGCRYLSIIPTCIQFCSCCRTVHLPEPPPHRSCLLPHHSQS